MTDLINTLVPIGTFIAGSLVTLAGQALHDRRMAEKERRARREDFRISNFDMHRNAMLEMQETARDYYEAFLAERRRLEHEGDYEYFDTHPLGDYPAAIKAAAIEQDDLNPLENLMARVEALEEPKRLSPELKQLINSELEQLTARLHEITAIMNAAAETAQGYHERLEKRSPYLEQGLTFIHRLRLLMHRSGSNSVVAAGDELIQAIYQWNIQFSSHRQDELVKRVKAAHGNLQQALANALTFGPYDTFGKQKSDRPA